MTRLSIVLLFVAGALFSQTPLKMPKADLLWPNGAPGAQGNEEIDQPSLAGYIVPAGRGTGAAVVVCPGGGYRNLAMDHEGDQIARWLNSLGVSAFVLKYRLGPKYHHPVELCRRPARPPHRALQSGRIPRVARPHRHHGLFGRRPPGLHRRHALRRRQRRRRRPYRPRRQPARLPGAGLSGDFVHHPLHAQRFAAKLLGNNPDPKLVESLSNELQVTAGDAADFLFHTTADATVPVENSVLILYGAAQGRSARRDAHLRARTARRGAGLHR